MTVVIEGVHPGLSCKQKQLFVEMERLLAAHYWKIEGFNQEN